MLDSLSYTEALLDKFLSGKHEKKADIVGCWVFSLFNDALQ